MNQLKILHLISQKPSFTGSGTFLQGLVKGCLLNNISQSLFYCTSSDDNNKYFFDQTIVPNQEILLFNTVELPFNLPGMSDIMPYPSSIFSKMTNEEISLYTSAIDDKIKNLINNFKPDVIWSHHLWILSFCAAKYKIPIIVFCHGSDILQTRKKSELIVNYKHSALNINAIIATSITQISEITDYYKSSNILHIGNFIRDDIFFLKPESYQKTKPIKLTYAGKVSFEKGVLSLVLACKELINFGYDIQVNILGSGTGIEYEEIQNEIKGYETMFRFLGLVSQEELSNILNNTDIFILPSFYEGLGLVVIESIACGCRIVISNLPNLVNILPIALLESEFISITSTPKKNVINKLGKSLFITHGNSLYFSIITQIEFHLKEVESNRNKISSFASEFSRFNYFDKLINLSNEIINKCNQLQIMI